jgi:hypothetical protein
MPESDKKGRKRTPSFRIEISGNDDKKHDILEKLASVRSELTRKHNKPMGNLQVIESLLDTLIINEGDFTTDILYHT